MHNEKFGISQQASVADNCHSVSHLTNWDLNKEDDHLLALGMRHRGEVLFPL